MKKIITILALAVTTVGAMAQAIPSATPKNNPDVRITQIPFSSINHNPLTNTGTFTNCTFPLTPNKVGDIWVIITNCPSVGVATYHFDFSPDNGSTYTATGLASNGIVQLNCNFNTNTYQQTVLFKTNVAAATISGSTHGKLSRMAGTTATNVYTFKVGFTQPAPFPY